jgi:hypothetical protein
MTPGKDLVFFVQLRLYERKCSASTSANVQEEAVLATAAFIALTLEHPRTAGPRNAEHRDRADMGRKDRS